MLVNALTAGISARVMAAMIPGINQAPAKPGLEGLLILLWMTRSVISFCTQNICKRVFNGIGTSVQRFFAGSGFRGHDGVFKLITLRLK
ncbi:hypothetical protein SERLA73DRAFT_169187 [Serpula lacrymans var. lacrymans S7.3]|uniref:Uncharacterized protein n=2 Tax=Serpula lacrymans var. lacrymans TaxID=341189 RepID=F8Q1F6_SERL3|nr:uncharacterized protein SERLADRAFT_450042 [Serpula lacrymans var. lacrymans S7.9]EGN98134.1 hypothetical protein SERLA73DRAFT_169187 [Serpula lacrymans var. lacrymans S7.3]EGO23714.1 hypothetical protein SERLADRAFT_450042 [Serpula lacrymans var. lacrymans S7.9]